MTKTLSSLAALILLACGPTSPEVDHRGEAGNYCKPDGSCNGPLLECVESPVVLGMSVYEMPVCRVKVKR